MPPRKAKAEYKTSNNGSIPERLKELWQAAVNLRGSIESLRTGFRSPVRRKSYPCFNSIDQYIFELEPRDVTGCTAGAGH